MTVITAILFHTLIEIKEVIVYGFALSNIENIEKVSDGFRIVGTWTTANDDWHIIGSLTGFQRDFAQIQNL